jgi:spermidine synthase
MACASAGPDPAFLSRESVESRLTTWDLTDLRYYNGAVHRAQFALPNFLRALLA